MAPQGSVACRAERAAESVGASANRIVNLTLHGIGEPRRLLEYEEDRVWLGEGALHDILDMLKDLSGYLITVDDGNESDADIVLPALEQRNLGAVFFVPAGKLNRERHLSYEGLKALVQAGMEIGTHGMNHKDWRPLTDAELEIEIEGSKRLLEQITGHPIVKAACPYGSYDRRILAHLRKAGFERVYTSDRGEANTLRWIQARNSLHAGDTGDSVRSLVESDSLPYARLARKVRCLVKRWR